jgi:hypothetical protein
MKSKALDAMPALWKLLILSAILLSASNANAFTSLSPAAGNQVRVNHLIWFQQPMSDPKNEPSREPIREATNDRMNDQTTHEMNKQTEVSLQQLGTHANVSQQSVPANSEGVKVASKTAHQLLTSYYAMNNLWQCQLFVDNVLIDSWQCQMEIDKVKSMKTVIVEFKANLDFSDIWSQIFVHFEADSNFSRYLSATLQQLSKMCSAFQMVATEHKPICNSNSSTFRFIVGFKQQHKLRLLATNSLLLHTSIKNPKHPFTSANIAE